MGDGYTEKDTGWGKFCTSFEVNAGEISAFVGILRSAGVYKENEEITVAQIAALMVYGSSDGTIPERDFMTKAISENKDKIEKTIKKLATKILEGKMSSEQAMGVLGQMVADMMKRSINSGEFAPNKPSTIARKGSSKPLIDTGQLKGSIDFELSTKRKGEK